MKRQFICLFFIILTVNLSAQEEIHLWAQSEIPYFKTNNLEEYSEMLWNTQCLFNITKPTLTIYQAQGKNCGKAVIIVPGGGYEMVSMQHEGHDVAKVLSENGITAAVLKYRLPLKETSDQPEKVPAADLKQALKILRSKAVDYGFDKDKTGVLGFSAGAHLSAYMASKKVERPDFSLLVYGCPRLTAEYIQWLEESLFHRQMTKEELKDFDILSKINHSTPPAFLVHSQDDDICHFSESTFYSNALLNEGVSCEMHLFPEGGHGFGLGKESDGTNQWIFLAINWIKRQ